MEIYWILLVVFHVTVPIHTGNSCKVHIEQDVDFVLFGQTAVLNCTSDCTNLSWETRLTKVRVSTDKTANFSWVEVRVSEWEDSPIHCLATDEDRHLVRVKPYVLPSQLDIDLKEVLEEDKEYEVTCSVYGVAPVEYVILSVTRGGELFLNRTYENDTRRGPQNLTETFKFIANRRDNLQDFACQVTLNLTKVSNTTMRSSIVPVRTYALPEGLRITAEDWVEKGTVTDISCDVPKAFPPEHFITMLSVDGFPDTSATGNVFTSFNLNTNDLPAAQHTLLCASEVFTMTKQSKMGIYIYDRPKVNLTVSREVVNLGDTVTADCGIVQGNAEYFGLSISVDGAEMKKEELPDLAEKVTITKRKPSLTVTCEIFIRDNNKALLKEEETLTVHYPPEFSDSSCPDSIVWVEGEERMFGCRSEGNPTPEEECSFNNMFLQTTTSFLAERKMSGVYTCQASNPIGAVNKSVEVTVQYPPGPTTLDISTTSSISEGDSVNLTCYSDSLPPPMYNWEIPPNAQVDSRNSSSITIKEASSYHSGVYTCHVSNRHGQSSMQRHLEVKSDNTKLLAAILGAVGGAIAVLLLGLAVHYLLQNGKKGFYDLVRRIPNNPHSTEVPLQENSSV